MVASIWTTHISFLVLVGHRRLLTALIRLLVGGPTPLLRFRMKERPTRNWRPGPMPLREVYLLSEWGLARR